MHIIAGSDAGLVNCALLQVLGRLEDFGADQPDGGEEARFPWWDQELPAETSRSQVVQNFLLEDHNHIPDKRSLHCFSDNNWTHLPDSECCCPKIWNQLLQDGVGAKEGTAD